MQGYAIRYLLPGTEWRSTLYDIYHEESRCIRGEIIFENTLSTLAFADIMLIAGRFSRTCGVSNFRFASHSSHLSGQGCRMAFEQATPSKLENRAAL